MTTMEQLKCIMTIGNENQKTRAIELLSNSVTEEEKIQKILDLFTEINYQKRNETNVTTFTKKIIEKPNEKSTYYKNFLESKSVNGLVYAPTQVGKSNATIQFILTSFEMGVPVIVSTDNRSDQCEQLYNRVQVELSRIDSTLMKVTDKNFGKLLEKNIITNNHKFVIFCLNNASQIEKLTKEIFYNLSTNCQKNNSFTKFAIVHDEADTVTKESEVEIVEESQAESHKKWLKLMDIFKSNLTHFDLKRVFVTATPENTVMLYNIESPDVISLEIPSTYTGYKDISYTEITKDTDIKEIFLLETKRIKQEKTFEAILYCNERQKTDGHFKMLTLLSSYLKCVINTYNSDGICVYLPTKTLLEKFQKLLKKLEYKWSIKKNDLITIKEMPIRVFYTLCKQLNQNCVITIGKDLIARGISYVSEDSICPLTATTMIYIPGSTMHSVGICQTIGRITGCAMQSLQRKLYAPKDVIDTYVNFNKNQESYIQEIKVSNDLTKNVIKGMTFEKLFRNIDRPKLGLKMNVKSEVKPNDCDESKMKHCIDLWWKADTIIGKILTFVYKSEIGVTEIELKEFIKSIGADDSWYTDIHKQNKEYKYVFTRSENRITKLATQASRYIKDYKL